MILCENVKNSIFPIKSHFLTVTGLGWVGWMTLNEEILVFVTSHRYSKAKIATTPLPDSTIDTHKIVPRHSKNLELRLDVQTYPIWITKTMPKSLVVKAKGPRTKTGYRRLSRFRIKKLAKEQGKYDAHCLHVNHETSMTLHFVMLQCYYSTQDDEEEESDDEDDDEGGLESFTTALDRPECEVDEYCLFKEIMQVRSDA